MAGQSLRFEQKRLLLVVGSIAQLLARLEMRNVLARQIDFLAGFRVASRPRGAVMQAETAKTANFNALTVGERAAHHFNQTFYRQLDILVGQMSLIFRQVVDQVRFGHRWHKFCFFHYRYSVKPGDGEIPVTRVGHESIFSLSRSPKLVVAALASLLAV